MEENYINIFTSFLGKLLEEGKIKLEDVGGLVKVFQTVAIRVKSRKQLIFFLDQFISKYPQLEALKNQLLDNNYKFNFNIDK